MALPPDLVSLSPEEAARRIALSFLDEAHAASLRLDDGDDVEALHDFRVGIRRLRSVLRAWADALRGPVSKKRYRRALRALQNATGGGRDAEVAVLWLEGLEDDLLPEHRSACRWMINHLQARRQAAMAQVRSRGREDFDRLEGDLRAALRTMRIEVDLDGGRVGTRYADQLAKKCRAHTQELLLHLSRVADLDDEKEAHEARITGKRLRYLLEPVRRDVPEARVLVKTMKGLQDLLGELNDAHVFDAEISARLADAPEDERSGLRELARRGQQRAEGLFAQLERDWLAGGAEHLLTPAEDLALALERCASSGREVERKYLLNALPAFPQGDVTTLEIEQGWLPGEHLQERLRRKAGPKGEVFLRTVKSGRGLVRVELEDETTAEIFAAMWPFTKGRRVLKRRHRVPHGGHVWEIDEFLDRRLFLAEVELRSPDEVAEIPPWLQGVMVREVTEEGGYTNLELAK